MSATQGAIGQFWKVFVENEARLAVAESADDPAYERVLAELHRIDTGLYLEFYSDPSESELIVTADGDRSLFALVREIVVAAPAIPGWIVRALKPKLGFPTTVSWDDVTVRIEEVVFAPLEQEGSDEFGLRLFVPGVRAPDVDNAHCALLRALDHGLGEEKLAESVHFTEVRPLPGEAERGDFIPLAELETFLEWRESGRGDDLSDSDLPRVEAPARDRSP